MEDLNKDVTWKTMESIPPLLRRALRDVRLLYCMFEVLATEERMDGENHVWIDVNVIKAMRLIVEAARDRLTDVNTLTLSALTFLDRKDLWEEND